jgi:hypothetical protein
MTVHLDSGTDVVIVEVAVAGKAADAALVAAHDTKYSWSYDTLTIIARPAAIESAHHVRL